MDACSCSTTPLRHDRKAVMMRNLVLAGASLIALAAGSAGPAQATMLTLIYAGAPIADGRSN
jgi:hypothetical protein